MRELVRINVESDILCIKAVDQMFIQEIHHLYDSILHDELREEVFQIVCQQQAIKEGTMMVGEEVVEWGVEKILEVLITYPLMYTVYFPCHTTYTTNTSHIIPSHV